MATGWWMVGLFALVVIGLAVAMSGAWVGAAGHWECRLGGCGVDDRDRRRWGGGRAGAVAGGRRGWRAAIAGGGRWRRCGRRGWPGISPSGRRGKQEDVRYAGFRREWGADFERRMFWFLMIQAGAAALLVGSMLGGGAASGAAGCGGLGGGGGAGGGDWRRGVGRIGRCGGFAARHGMARRRMGRCATPGFGGGRGIRIIFSSGWGGARIRCWRLI